MTDVTATLNRATQLHQQGELDAAGALYDKVLAQFDAVLAVEPGHAAALVNKGNVLSVMGRFEEALGAYDRALAKNPGDAGTRNNRGSALLNLGRAREALAEFESALAHEPGHVEALYNRGNLQWQLGHGPDALASYAQLLARAPRHAGALNNRGAVLWALGQRDAALASYAQALAAQPGFIPALNNLGQALTGLRRFEESLAYYERTLALAPDNVAALDGRAGLLLRLKRYPQALEAYRQILIRAAGHRHALGGMLTAALNLCDWEETETLMPRIADGLEQDKAIVPPFMLLGASGDKALQLGAAQHAAQDAAPDAATPLWSGERYSHDRIRIAYLSSDYGQHPVPALLAQLIEAHDRKRFEVLGVSTGLDDKSAVRARIVKAFDRFHDMQAQSPLAVSQLLRHLEVDILIELNGHTDGDHFAVLSHRPCPVQVNYLGYPGTGGSPFLDYLLADAAVAPFADQAFFAERIVHLPGCYFPTSYDPVTPPPSREAAGLPRDVLVFANFNNSWKFTRTMFDVWMRLLKDTPGSVLWLLAANPDLRARLAKEAGARGVDAARLVYAERTTPEKHLARMALADLMLDTQPYNGHMTTSDALWVGVPLVTTPGTAFAGRVAASLLAAAGMPELIAKDLPGYEALALKLAQRPDLRNALREKMALGRATAPLFDAKRLCRAVETAYARMHAIRQAGEAPQSFAVD